MEVVHIWHRHPTLPHDVVVAHEDRCHGTQENRISTEESEEFRGRSQDLPGDETPASDHGSEELTAADVDVPGAEGHEVVGRADRVR